MKNNTMLLKNDTIYSLIESKIFQILDHTSILH